jgi:adenylate cyclase class 2
MEIEAKFQLPSHFDIRQRILSLGARSLTGRFLERNTRLDTADRALAADHKLLRLRQGLKNTLELLGALGYQKTVIYEKYREIYALNEVLLMLDEVPYGCFIEIEGQELEQIREAAKQLGLEWSTRVQRSYIAMFNRLRERLEFDFEDVTFSNFASIDPVPQELLKQVLA